MIPDSLLINLKIVSKIQKNGRICKSADGIISLESESFYQPFKRFLSNDSRKQAVFEINSVITEAIETMHHLLNNKIMTSSNSQSEEYYENYDSLNLLLTSMIQATIGVENLKFTYQNDLNTVSQLDIIILKLNNSTRTLSSKLQVFKSLLNNPNIVTTTFGSPIKPHTIQDTLWAPPDPSDPSDFV